MASRSSRVKSRPGPLAGIESPAYGPGVRVEGRVRLLPAPLLPPMIPTRSKSSRGKPTGSRSSGSAASSAAVRARLTVAARFSSAGASGSASVRVACTASHVVQPSSIAFRSASPPAMSTGSSGKCPVGSVEGSGLFNASAERVRCCGVAGLLPRCTPYTLVLLFMTGLSQHCV